MKKVHFYYAQLSNFKSRELYYKILCSVQKHDNTAKVEKAGLTQDDVLVVLYALEYDYPELFYVNFFGEGCSITRYGNGDVEVRFRYRFSLEEQRKVIQENRSFIQYLVSHLPVSVKPSKYETALWLHDLLIRNICYNYDALTGGLEKEPDAYTILGGSRSKKAVCSGISKLYQILCEYEEIWCIYVTGYARTVKQGNVEGSVERHGWNMIGVDNAYAYVDVTWDLREGEKTMPLSHAYFGMSDGQCAKQHEPELKYPGMRLPACVENNPLNYYIRRKCRICSFGQLGQYIQEIIRQREKMFSFQINLQGEDPLAVKKRTVVWMKEYLTKEADQIASWSWRCNEIMLVFDYSLTYRNETGK